jgi:CheY-like chemotaxis protein
MTGPLLLLVDDAPEIGFIVQRLCKRAGQEVVHCVDAESAWQRLTTDPVAPDLVILDLNLPGLSGAGLCRRLRDDPTTAPLRVALFSHWERLADIVQGLEGGADTVLSKDLMCNADDWRRRVVEILDDLNGRNYPYSLSWQEAAAASSSAFDQAALLEKALGHATLRRLGPDVACVLIQRVIRRIGLASMLTSTNGPAGTLRAENVARGLGPSDVSKFVLALAEQMQIILGTAASEVYRTALARCAPSLWRRPADG